MNTHLATDEQLFAVIKEDKECPSHLLRGIVHEALDRGLFNAIITWVFKDLTKNPKKVKQRWKMENADILSVGHCGVLAALKKWKPGNSSFKAFAFMNIRTEFVRLLERESAEKRQTDKVTFSYETKLSSGDAYFTLLSEKTNVEEIVLKKLEYEEKTKPLTDKETKVIHLFLEGYSFGEIKQKLFKRKITNRFVREFFYDALAKIGLQNYTIEQQKEIKHSQQKLTPEIVREIRAAKLTFKNKDEEAAYYGISRKLIYNIRKNKAWKEVI